MNLFTRTTGIASKYLVQIVIVILFALGGVALVSRNSIFKEALTNIKGNDKITDISRYKEVRHKLWSNESQIKYFPKDIPSDATNVSLVYSKGYLKGGNFFQVRFKLPSDKIKKLHSHYQKIAQHKFRGGDTNDHVNRPNGVPTTYFYTSGSDYYTFPAVYEILVLNANNKSSSGNKWVRGDSYGVAIDDYASEIVYWVEEW